MKLCIAADHRGYELKTYLKHALEDLGHEVTDFGCDHFDPEDDYPDFIIPAVKAAVSDGCKAIVLGYSGQGEGIAANKVPGARAAVYYGGTHEIIRLSREDNDANVLSLGAGFLKPEESLEAVSLWLATSFSGAERHVRRLAKLP